MIYLNIIIILNVHILFYTKKFSIDEKYNQCHINKKIVDHIEEHGMRRCIAEYSLNLIDFFCR